MIPAFRYHVVTLVGIFLALGVGMIIGGSYVQGPIVETLSRRLESLNQQFSKEVAPLREANKRLADGLAATRPLLTHGKLTGKTVVLVQTGDYPAALQGLNDAFMEAGAAAVYRVKLSSTASERLAVRADELRTQLKLSTDGDEKAAGQVLRALAAAIYRSASSQTRDVFSAANLAEWDGDFARQADYIVLVGGSLEDNESRIRAIDIPLIGALKVLGAIVAAAEPSDAGASYMGALANTGISTVDNAETELGRIALVLALISERGDYGIKRSARSGLLPSAPSSP